MKKLTITVILTILLGFCVLTVATAQNNNFLGFTRDMRFIILDGGGL